MKFGACDGCCWKGTSLQGGAGSDGPGRAHVSILTKMVTNGDKIAKQKPEGWAKLSSQIFSPSLMISIALAPSRVCRLKKFGLDFRCQFPVFTRPIALWFSWFCHFIYFLFLFSHFATPPYEIIWNFKSLFLFFCNHSLHALLLSPYRRSVGKNPIHTVVILFMYCSNKSIHSFIHSFGGSWSSNIHGVESKASPAWLCSEQRQCHLWSLSLPVPKFSSELGLLRYIFVFALSIRFFWIPKLGYIIKF